MKYFVGILFIGLFLTVANAAAQTALCFENKGLKGDHRISFELDGNKIVEGYYETMSDPTGSAETFSFSGVKTGSLLTVKFQGTIPYELPPGTKKIVWTLDKNVLKVRRYGKNYQTNRFAVYTADYEKCSDN